ncbi:hypothetical protein O8I66_04935 [Campylobacter lari]|uniref:hypothetical protein n=1 Tax=Campylobacter lari TaxID=201 RepID=UPI00372C68FF
MWQKIRTFRLKGFLKKRARRLIHFLSKKFDITIVEIKNHTNIQQKKSNLSQKSLFALWQEIFNFEKSYPVDILKNGEIYLYPLIRQWLWLKLTNYFFHKKNSFKIKLVYGFEEIPINMRARLKEQYNVKDIQEAREKVHYLFLTSYASVENIKIDNGKIYQRIIDPIYEEVGKYGKTLKISFLQNYLHIYKYQSNDFLYPIELFMLPMEKKTRFINEDIFSYDFFKKINLHIESLDIDIDEIIEMLNDVFYSIECYLEILKRINPKIIFLHSFFYHIPIIIAAHKLGICVVDIQHGEISSKNPAYGGFDNFLKKNGIYNFLPDVFFVWSNKYLKHIQATFPINNKSIIIGNFWIDKQKQFYKHLAWNYLIKKRVNNKQKIVLFLLSNSSKIDTFFLSLINLLDDNFLILIRHHPKPRRLFTKNDFLNKQNVVIDKLIDDCILGELFERCDCCISAGSAASKEANYFNIINFVFGEIGKINFQEEIEDGEIVFLNTPEDFFNHIESTERSSCCVKSDKNISNLKKFLESFK